MLLLDHRRRNLFVVVVLSVRNVVAEKQGIFWSEGTGDFSGRSRIQPREKKKKKKRTKDRK